MLTLTLCLIGNPDQCKHYEVDVGGVIACAYQGQSQVMQFANSQKRYTIKEWRCK